MRDAFVATLVNRSGTMALPFLVIMLHERGHSPEASGSILAAFGAGSLVAGPGAGWLVARVGARRVMIGSLLASAAAMVAMPWVSSLARLAVLAFVWALVGEAFRPAASAVVAEHAPVARRREAFALLRLAANLGMSLGPAIGGALARRSFAALFILDGGTSVAAAVWLLAFTTEQAPPRPEAASSAPDGSPSRIHVRPLATHLLAVLLIAILAYQGLSTLPLFMTDGLGLSEASYGIVFAFSGILVVAFEVPITARSSQWEHRRLLVVGAVLTAIGFGVLAFVRGIFGVVAATVVWTTGEMLVSPAAAARVADLEPRRRRGVLLGVYNATWSVAFALGPWLGARSLDRFGARGHWLLMGAVGLVSALAFAVRRSPQRPGATSWREPRGT